MCGHSARARTHARTHVAMSTQPTCLTISTPPGVGILSVGACLSTSRRSDSACCGALGTGALGGLFQVFVGRFTLALGGGCECRISSEGGGGGDAAVASAGAGDSCSAAEVGASAGGGGGGGGGGTAPALSCGLGAGGGDGGGDPASAVAVVLELTFFLFFVPLFFFFGPFESVRTAAARQPRPVAPAGRLLLPPALPPAAAAPDLPSCAEDAFRHAARTRRITGHTLGLDENQAAQGQHARQHQKVPELRHCGHAARDSAPAGAGGAVVEGTPARPL